MGKSLYIQRMAEKLRKRIGVENGVHIIIPIHGPVVTADMLLDLFEEGLNKDLCTLYHLDIAPNVRCHLISHHRNSFICFSCANADGH